MQAETRVMRLVDPILMEMDQEAEITKRLFDIIPEDKLSWRPHPKAKSLGELAMHIAWLQGAVAELTQPETVEIPDFPPDPEAKSRKEIFEAFTQSLKKAKEIVGSMDDAQVMAEYTITKDGKTLMAAPRISFWRSILLNHNYHHRGQLSTYLRTLDVPLPSIYGPSADTNPFN
ncbi:MAG TPA: DinB family protein [Pyrinomonadaceae bacterium]|nr:DinB family protein [Pyrinomonadaceae bacterium]